MSMHPLIGAHYAVLRDLQQQDDVWEFVGTLPQPQERDPHRLFAVMEGDVPIGIGGLIRSQAFDGKDYEALCALRSEAQRGGLAKRACELILTWAFGTAGAERVIACVDDHNDGARTIETKIGMQELE